MLKQIISKAFSYFVLKVKTFNMDLLIARSATVKLNTRLKKMTEEGVIEIGSNVSIGYNTEIYVWRGRLFIGNNSSMNDNCKIYENVTIGQFCLFASNVFVSSGTHVFSHNCTLPIKLQDQMVSIDKPVTIEDDCWIGFGVVILPGVYVGKGAVLGANSVVSKDVSPYTVVGGIPAKRISDRFDFVNKAPSELSSTNPSHWPYFYRGVDYNCLKEPEKLGSGLNINSDLTILFLKKMHGEKIQLEGMSFLATDFYIYLNEDLINVIKVEVGDFTTDLTIPKERNHKGRHLVAQIPAFLKDQFTICAIEVISHQKVTREIRWKVKKVGIL